MGAVEFGGFVAGIAVCAFGYFIYTKVKASKAKKAGGSGGGGGRPNDNSVPKQDSK